MSSYDISLTIPERWRELFAWLEAGASDAVPSAERAVSAPIAFEDPGPMIALYAAYLAGKS
jgi:hypothetical protein